MMPVMRAFFGIISWQKIRQDNCRWQAQKGFHGTWISCNCESSIDPRIATVGINSLLIPMVAVEGEFFMITRLHIPGVNHHQVRRTITPRKPGPRARHANIWVVLWQNHSINRGMPSWILMRGLYPRAFCAFEMSAKVMGTSPASGGL